MRTLFLIPIAFLSNLFTIQAQSEMPAPRKLYKTWISFQGEQNKKKGALYEVRDSSVVISTSYIKTDYFNGNNYGLTKLDVRNINVINVRKNKAIGTGVLFGSLSGVALGGLIGLTSTNTAQNEKANSGIQFTTTIFTTIFMGACGAAIGAVFGTIKTKIHIHGSQEQFEKKKNKLNKRSLIFDPLMEGQRLTSFSHLRDTVVDAEGNVYHTIALGAMVFMAENLKVTHFRNGKEIPLVKDTADWREADGAAYCNYRNDSGNVVFYGKLYNGYAITDTSGICPVGWHVPSYDEWTSLIMCLGGKDNAAGYMKEAGTSHWINPNKTMLSDNTFSLPSGSRDRKGVFSLPGHTCQWWIAKEKGTANLQALYLSNESTGVRFNSPDKNSGLSVRCIRDN